MQDAFCDLNERISTEKPNFPCCILSHLRRFFVTTLGQWGGFPGMRWQQTPIIPWRLQTTGVRFHGDVMRVSFVFGVFAGRVVQCFGTLDF